MVFRRGRLVALLVCGLRRLFRVMPTDTWPLKFELGTARLSRPPHRVWIPWALRLAVISLVIPIMKNPDGLGFADWDFVLDKFEALRRTVLVWGQFPWWNPWSRGGFPLAAEPQIGAVSIATPLVLALGSSIGLRLAAILCVLIAVEGAFRLAWLWFREPWPAATVALIYGLNGGVIINTAQGYILAMSYCSLPWLAYHAFRIGDRFVDGIGLGGWMAFVILNGIQYLSFYGGLLAGLIWARAVRVQPGASRARLLVHTLAAVGVFLGVCGWRLIPILLVLADDKREQITHWDESLFAVPHYLLTRPLPNWPKVIPGRHWATVYRADQLRRSRRRLACSGEPGTGMALVAYLDPRHRLVGNRLDAMVSPQLLARELAFLCLGPRRDPLAVRRHAGPGAGGR